MKHYLSRMRAKIPHFETMEEPELNYIKVGIIDHDLAPKSDN